MCTQAGARFCADVHAIGKLGFVLPVYTQAGGWVLRWYARKRELGSVLACTQAGSWVCAGVHARGEVGFVLACTQAETELSYVLVCTQAGARFCASVHTSRLSRVLC